MKVVIDTDLSMGEHGSEVDDGIAIALALADPRIEVCAITTVHGNARVTTATRLTRTLLDTLGRGDVPVIEGAARPLAWPSHHDGAADDPDGGDAAATAFVDLVRRYPGEVTVVAIGPLTNVALAVRLDPEFASLVDRIVVMGGLFFGQRGLWSQPGEFNFWVDPHAANVVLDSGGSIDLVGLDVTERVRLSTADMAAVRKGSTVGAYIAPYFESWIDFLRSERPGAHEEITTCAMHDPLALATTTAPELVTWRAAAVRVAEKEALTRGIAVTDLLEEQDPPLANCRIAVEVNVDAARERIIDLLAGA